MNNYIALFGTPGIQIKGVDQLLADSRDRLLSQAELKYRIWFENSEDIELVELAMYMYVAPKLLPVHSMEMKDTFILTARNEAEAWIDLMPADGVRKLQVNPGDRLFSFGEK